VDREGEIGIASGMNDSHFKLNPIVTLYACTFLPMSQSALVEAVSKSPVKPEILSALGIELPPPPCGLAAAPVVPFTPEAEIQRAIERRIAAFDFEAVANHGIAAGIDRVRGRV
jgi:hypothetical protein